jgi:hypothetical protein
MLSTSAALRRALLLLLAAASQRLALVSADEEEPEPEPEDECRIPPDLTREQRCEYVESTEACDEIAEVIDYLEIYYCSDVSQGVANFLLLCFALWWCLLIVVLGTTADEYFCPPLTAMARWLRLRPRVAAVRQWACHLYVELGVLGVLRSKPGRHSRGQKAEGRRVRNDEMMADGAGWLYAVLWLLRLLRR